MAPKIKVGMVEDQHLFMQGMKAILSSWEDIDVVFESSDGVSVVEKLRTTETLPDVMLVDFSLPDVGQVSCNGNDVIAALRIHYPSIKVIMLSVHQDENFIVQAIEHGAYGYLIKDSDPEELYDAIVSVYTKGSYINARALQALQKKNVRRQQTTPERNEILSKREIEILELVCQQMTAEEIADKLFISVKTVNGHRTNLLEKTGAKNVAGLVLYAIKHKIVSI